MLASETSYMSQVGGVGIRWAEGMRRQAGRKVGTECLPAGRPVMSAALHHELYNELYNALHINDAVTLPRPRLCCGAWWWPIGSSRGSSSSTLCSGKPDLGLRSHLTSTIQPHTLQPTPDIASDVTYGVTPPPTLQGFLSEAEGCDTRPHGAVPNGGGLGYGYDGEGWV